MKLVWKILKSNISPWQLVGFALANFLGITILMLTLQFHSDVYPSLSGENALVGKDYLVISKKAGLFRSLMGNSTRFDQEEIDALKANDKIADLGGFKASNYDVYAGLDLGDGNHISTDLFFESVPDRFVDADDFHWEPEAETEDSIIPIMIPKEYLDLYNFGFSSSQGLPQLSETMLKSLVLDIRLRGAGKTFYMKGRISGFSKYLNTVLVPESFMDWANGELAPGSEDKTSRMLLSVKNPNDIDLITAIEDEGYEIAQNKEAYSKLTFLLNLVTAIILVIGAVISLLSFFILTLSIWLLIEKNHCKISALELLGYGSRTVAVPYSVLIAGIDAVTVALAASVTLLLRSWYSGTLSTVIPVGSGNAYTFASAVSIFAVITVLHLLVLIFTIRKVYRKK